MMNKLLVSIIVLVILATGCNQGRYPLFDLSDPENTTTGPAAIAIVATDQVDSMEVTPLAQETHKPTTEPLTPPAQETAMATPVVTEEVVIQPPDGWFKWEGPTLMRWSEASASYKEYIIPGTEINKNETVIDGEGNRFTLMALKEGTSRMMPVRVIESNGKWFNAVDLMYTDGDQVYAFVPGVGYDEWVALTDISEPLAEFTRRNEERWLNGEIQISEDELYENKGNKQGLRIAPDTWPVEHAIGHTTVQAVVLGVEEIDGRMVMAFGVEGRDGRRHVFRSLTPDEGGYAKFRTIIQRGPELFKIALGMVMADRKHIPALVNQVVGKPVLVTIANLALESDKIGGGAHCNQVAADAGTRMVREMSTGDFSNLPHLGDELPCATSLKVQAEAFAGH